MRRLIAASLFTILPAIASASCVQLAGTRLFLDTAQCLVPWQNACARPIEQALVANSCSELYALLAYYSQRQGQDVLSLKPQSYLSQEDRIAATRFVDVPALAPRATGMRAQSLWNREPGYQRLSSASIVSRLLEATDIYRQIRPGENQNQRRRIGATLPWAVAAGGAYVLGSQGVDAGISNVSTSTR